MKLFYSPPCRNKMKYSNKYSLLVILYNLVFLQIRHSKFIHRQIEISRLQKVFATSDTDQIIQIILRSWQFSSSTSENVTNLGVALATGSRTITSDRTVHNNSSLSFSSELVGTISLGWKLLRSNKLITLFCLDYIQVHLKLRKCCNLEKNNSRHAWHTSFERKRLNFDLRGYSSVIFLTLLGNFFAKKLLYLLQSN